MKTTLNTLHHQATDWKRELEFYNDELVILNKRLEEIASKNTDKDTMAKLEHFQNTFIMLKEEIDILKHDVQIREEHVESSVKSKPEHAGEKIKVGGDKIFDRMMDLANSVATTRYGFNQFLSKVM
jgi:hypothetical protein